MDHSFPFSDLHSFKDYVAFAQTYLTLERFPKREGVGPEDQWTAELAFEGLRLGLRMADEEKGEREEIARSAALVEEASIAYREGRPRDGFRMLEDVRRELRKVPSR